ncbi:uncharacterized protein BJ171DRAFT_491116 [Polychytrium aggregatum]|uniref:uncharacterized protein n=1 Tax=Polychytrium aggregatum TaxID=110093 RepID=UPI0022FE44C2|nr:uncharacterized protein BJ171DRAFT_491116 [Polychytrium aggregatum]KAI9208367.1 hypothetical protein BJ171DRAFT_491116 [Polychytrium aggregatum]
MKSSLGFVLLSIALIAAGTARATTSGVWLNTDDIYNELIPTDPVPAPLYCLRDNCLSIGGVVDQIFNSCNATIMTQLSASTPPDITKLKLMVSDCICGSDENARLYIVAMWQACVICQNSLNTTALGQNLFTTACQCQSPPPIDFFLDPLTSRKCNTINPAYNSNSRRRPTGPPAPAPPSSNTTNTNTNSTSKAAAPGTTSSAAPSSTSPGIVINNPSSTTSIAPSSSSFLGSLLW